MGPSELIFWFEEIGGEHSGVVGKKCVNLGVVTRMGMPVPHGLRYPSMLTRGSWRQHESERK
jgi:phosphoenolpyruvate synthase/pyruvate phosphate dikinase